MLPQKFFTLVSWVIIIINIYVSAQYRNKQKSEIICKYILLSYYKQNVWET